MGRRDELDDLRQAEWELLRRCKAFVLAHPDSDGGVSKNILYLTPCGEWIQICSRDIDTGDPDWSSVESAYHINTGMAASIFVHYDWQMPPELVGESPEEVRCGKTIQRNQLRDYLQSLSSEWPEREGSHSCKDSCNREDIYVPTLDEKSIKLSECEKDILRSLLKGNGRQTRDKVIASMSKADLVHGESTIRNALAKMRQESLLDNYQKTKPRGFGLTAEGLAIAQHLSKTCPPRP
jgi:hypothetical protein